MDAERIARIAKALGHPARVQLVALLATQCECRGAEVFSELPLAQSTISEHLRVLREAGVVSASSDGPRSVYCLEPNAIADLADALANVRDSARCCLRGDCS
jgi:ArsR family transcriptional regulator